MTKKELERERHDVAMGEMSPSHVPTTALGTMTKASADRIRDLSRLPAGGVPHGQSAAPVDHTFLDIPLAIIGCLIGLIWAWVATSAVFPVLGGAAAGAFAGYYAIPALIGLCKITLKLAIAAAVVTAIYYICKWLS